MVNTKDQSNSIVSCVCYVVCGQCQHIQRKLLGWLLMLHCVENVSNALIYMPLNALEILIPSVDSVNIYSIDGMVAKPSVSAFQNFLRIENWLNIKKVIGRNV